MLMGLPIPFNSLGSPIDEAFTGPGTPDWHGLASVNLLAFQQMERYQTAYSCIIALVNNAMAEMGSFMPVSGGFIRMAGHWVDDALGFTAGWNFFLYEALLIPFEITALNIVLRFWRDDIPVAAVCAAVIVLYAYVSFFFNHDAALDESRK